LDDVTYHFACGSGGICDPGPITGQVVHVLIKAQTMMHLNIANALH